MTLLRRELAIVLRARLTWVQAALSALLVGHSFILAVDIFSAGSRSALGHALMARELDPLQGIVRPMLGGLYVAASLLAPIAAVRPLAIEKERHTFAMLLLQTGAPLRVVLAKYTAACVGVGVQVAAPLLLLAVWLALGGHLGGAETTVAILGQALYLLLVAAIATAAAAWNPTVAQAATTTLIAIAASWAIDAAEGFAALAWLGRALEWSVTTHLIPSERGMVMVGAWVWMAGAAAGALALGYVGVRIDLPPRRRTAGAVAVVALTLLACAAATRLRRGYDTTELQRVSLPPAVSTAVRGLAGPIALEVSLDRDDPRRQQMEADVITKLRLARPDLSVETPEDESAEPVEGIRDEGYGRTIVRAGGGERVTYSASRKEIVTLLFEAARQPLPEWSQADYPGYPLVVEGARRTVTAGIAYGVIPLGLLVTGFVTRPKSRREAGCARDG
jgi:hypothetical protein